MTPAINAAKKLALKHQIHEYQHDISCASYGMEAAEKLGIPHGQVFKTLVVALPDKALVVAVIPVASKLSMKLIAKAAGAKKAAMAEPAQVARSTGYVLGGVSPLGQKQPLPTFIDSSAQQQPSLLVSAGRRGLEIELSLVDLVGATQGMVTGLCLQS